jgi:hypothetical protein
VLVVRVLLLALSQAVQYFDLVQRAVLAVLGLFLRRRLLKSRVVHQPQFQPQLDLILQRGLYAHQ